MHERAHEQFTACEDIKLALPLAEVVTCRGSAQTTIVLTDQTATAADATEEPRYFIKQSTTTGAHESEVTCRSEVLCVHDHNDVHGGQH